MAPNERSDAGQRLIDGALMRRVKLQRQPGHGLFACPSCRTDREHTLVGHYVVTGLLGRFLPPRGPMEQVTVECDTCKHGFDKAVLDRPPFGSP